MNRFLIAAAAVATLAAPMAAAPAMAQYGGGYGYAPPPPPPPPPPAEGRWDRDGRWDGMWRGDRDDQRWEPSEHYRAYERRQLSEQDRVYHGRDGRYYCKRSDGTTGLVLGAVGGGILGNVLGGGTLGTILGAGGGGLLGRTLDQRNDAAQNRRNGYYCD